MNWNLFFCIIILISNCKLIAQDQSRIELLDIDPDNLYSQDLEDKFLVVRKTRQLDEFKVEKLQLVVSSFDKDSTGVILDADNVVFMISGIKLPERVVGMDCKNQMLFPGQTLRFDYNISHVQLYGKGKPIINKDSTELMPYSMIKDYELRIRSKYNGKILDQAIFKGDVGKWMDSQYFGGASVIWIGDLNNDNFIDLVYRTYEHHEEYSLHLLMSSKESKGLLKEVAVSSYGY